MMYQSIGPKNDGNALLVMNGFVITALRLQTHNQILPCAVQIYGTIILSSETLVLSFD